MLGTVLGVVVTRRAMWQETQSLLDELEEWRGTDITTAPVRMQSS